MRFAIKTAALAATACATWFWVQAPRAEAVDGHFLAERSCEAYASKNNRTNPGRVRTQPRTEYQVIERNRPKNPDYYRILLPQAKPQERWVQARCGQFTADGGGMAGGGSSGGGAPAGGGTGGGACHIAGRPDSHTLALSWQPAFCESHGDKPECGITDPETFQASNFTLHGLWPEKNACGQAQGYFSFCGSVKKQEKEFCHYPAVALDTETRNALGVVMPSVGAGSCLERHEWHKHGTCGGADAIAYYALATRLVHQFNESGMGAFMSRNIGKTVQTETFLTQVDKSLGVGARKRISINCNSGLLVDLNVSLPATLAPDADLKTLIAQGPAESSTGSCKQSFRVDPIGR